MLNSVGNLSASIDCDRNQRDGTRKWELGGVKRRKGRGQRVKRRQVWNVPKAAQIRSFWNKFWCSVYAVYVITARWDVIACVLRVSLRSNKKEKLNKKKNFKKQKERLNWFSSYVSGLRSQFHECQHPRATGLSIFLELFFFVGFTSFLFFFFECMPPPQNLFLLNPHHRMKVEPWLPIIPSSNTKSNVVVSSYFVASA